MLADFMFTPKQQRVLAAFLLHPERAYSFSELAERASGGHSSLQLFLDKLLSSGVLRSQLERTYRRYKVNADHPLFPELQRIAIKSFAVLEPVRQALLPLAPSIERAFVFGSTAAGTATHASDVDLMVIGGVRMGELRMAMEEAESLIGREVHLNLYGPDEWSRLTLEDPVIRSIAEGPTLELNFATVMADSQADAASN